MGVVLLGAGCGQGSYTNSTTNPASIDPAATSTTNDPPVETEPTQAYVDSVEVVILESFPVQVQVHIKGHFSNGCGQLGDIKTERNGNVFNVKVQGEQPVGAICTQALKPFEEQIGLDVLGLKKGTYTVDVNGVKKDFTLDADNILKEE